MRHGRGRLRGEAGASSCEICQQRYMHVQRVNHTVTGLSPIEGRSKVGASKHNCLRTLFVDHSTTGVDECCPLQISAHSGNGNVLIDLAKPLDVVIAGYGARAGQLAIQSRTHNHACAKQANARDSLVGESVIERGHSRNER